MEFIELAPDKVLIGTVKGCSFAYYSVRVQDTSKMLTIVAAPENEESDPDIYVGKELPVTQGKENCIWKSSSIGADKLQIHPEDPNYTEGTYYIGIYGYKPDINTFSVVFRLEFVPESILLNDSFTGTIEKWAYFKFPVQHPGESRIEVTVSPGIGFVQMFVSSNLFFPNEEEHVWSAGVYALDSPSDSEDPFRERENDPDPYDNVLKRSYLRKPTEREIQRLTLVEQQSGEAVRFCIDTDDWKYSSQTCYIGLKVISGGSLQVTVKQKEYLEEELLSGNIAKKYEIFKSIFANVEGSSISQNERKRLECTGKSEFTYGEIDFVHIAPIIQLCKPQPGEVFWDLGCGAGKCMTAMALLHPELKKISGVEYLDLLYESCKSSMEAVKKEAEGVEISVHHGDMLEVDWSDADILFSSSICFPSDLIEGILEKCYLLKKGARFITLKNFPKNYIFETKFNTRVKMTWGKTGVYVLEKIE